jgi:hypothetical protein
VHQAVLDHATFLFIDAMLASTLAIETPRAEACASALGVYEADCRLVVVVQALEAEVGCA